MARFAYADPPYPGSGAVGRAWESWRAGRALGGDVEQTSLEVAS